MSKRYYLAELDPTDNPTLIDGPHASPQQVADASRMHRNVGTRRFVCAEVILSDLDCTRVEVPAIRKRLAVRGEMVEAAA